MHVEQRMHALVLLLGGWLRGLCGDEKGTVRMPPVQAAAPKGKVRVRGRWLFRCFNCYVQEDDLLLVEAERLNSKISKKERAEETSKQRLLLGTTTKRPH